MTAASSSLPLRFLLPHRAYVRKCLKEYHAESVESCSHKGGFDPSNTKHRLVDYYQLLDTTHIYRFLYYSPTFNFNSVQSRLDKGPESREEFQKKVLEFYSAEAAYLAYEAHLLEHEILEPAKRQAELLELDFVKMPYITYGGTAVTALDLHKKQDESNRFIATRVSSGTYCDAPQNVDLSILTPEQWSQDLFPSQRKLPLVAAIDGTGTLITKAGPKRFRFPDSFHGGANLAALTNLVLGVDAQSLGGKEWMGTARFRVEDQAHLVETMSKWMGQRDDKSEFFAVHPAALDSGEPDAKPPSFHPDQIQGPGTILVNTTMSHTSIETRAAEGDRAAQITLAYTRRLARVFAADFARAGEDVLTSDLESPETHQPAAFDDNDEAQRAYAYISRSGRVKIKPPVHPLASETLQLIRAFLASDSGDCEEFLDQYLARQPDALLLGRAARDKPSAPPAEDDANALATGAPPGVAGPMGPQTQSSSAAGTGMNPDAQRAPHKEELRLVQEVLRLNPRHTERVKAIIAAHASAKDIVNPLTFLDQANDFHSNVEGHKIKDLSFKRALRSAIGKSPPNRFADMRSRLDAGMIWPPKF